ncbi:hypothetical protein D918_01763, partial [Trichuris suis]
LLEDRWRTVTCARLRQLLLHCRLVSLCLTVGRRRQTFLSYFYADMHLKSLLAIMAIVGIVQAMEDINRESFASLLSKSRKPKGSLTLRRARQCVSRLQLSLQRNAKFVLAFHLTLSGVQYGEMRGACLLYAY